MAKSKAVQPDNVLRSVFKQGIKEMRDAGMIVRAGNTEKHGGGLVVSIPAWRYCSVCEEVVPVGDMATSAMCQYCAAESADVPVLAQRDASEVPA